MRTAAKLAASRSSDGDRRRSSVLLKSGLSRRCWKGKSARGSSLVEIFRYESGSALVDAVSWNVSAVAAGPVTSREIP